MIKGDDDRLLVVVGYVLATRLSNDVEGEEQEHSRRRSCLEQCELIYRPCSIHDPEQALTYARKLYAYAQEAKDDLMIVMRVYFEK